MNLTQKVFNIVSEIPSGRVVTYGDIAAIANTGPRVVGNILHKNTDPKSIPCHRVVNSRGLTAPSYAFGGFKAQEEILREEGIVFRNGKIDLSTYRWKWQE